MKPKSDDWTAEGGRSNSSYLYLRAVSHVAVLIRHNGGACLDPTWVENVSRLIVSQLAHNDGFAPPLDKSA